MGRNYIDNEKFEDMILRYQAAKDKPRRRREYLRIQEELVGQFYLLAENLLRAFNFRLVDRDEALQEGVFVCLQRVECFDPNRRGQNGEKCKAFNYLTTCCLNHFRQMYRSNKHYLEFKLKYHDFMLRKNPDIRGRHTVELGRLSQSEEHAKG